MSRVDPLSAYEIFFAASATTLDTARRAGVIAVSTLDAHNLGFRGNGYVGAELKGLVFQCLDPRNGRKPTLLRLRPDQPVTVDGQQRKYLAPPGSKNRF